MRACILRCEGCGKDFVAQRRHRQWCSDSCRKRTIRASAGSGRAVPDWEPAVIAEIAAGRLTPDEGIRWMIDPEGMRRRYPHRSSGLAA
jgi:hypothetical protein